MRIVHAIRSASFAGVERFVLRLAVQQARDGHAVQVIGGSPGRMRPALSEHGIGFSPVHSRLETISAIRAEARSADVVNTHMTDADVAGVLGLTALRPRPALVSTRHFMSPRGRGSHLPIDALISRGIDAEISISEAVAGAIDRKSTVVHSGVDIVDDANSERGRTVLMAQRLEPEKRTDAGIRAFAASGLQKRGWTLEIAGDGSERAPLEALAAQLGVAARFLGFRNDALRLMAGAGIYLAPCAVEGLGLSVLEAMSCGTPVVAANAGGHTEILEGFDERALYSPDDADAAGAHLRSLADDDVGRTALGVALRTRQREGFSLIVQATGTEAVYREAIGRRTRRP